MEKAAIAKKGVKTAGEFVTVGDIKLPVELWTRVITYKNNQRLNGRKLRMPEASIELMERGLNAEGL